MRKCETEVRCPVRRLEYCSGCGCGCVTGLSTPVRRSVLAEVQDSFPAPVWLPELELGPTTSRNHGRCKNALRLLWLSAVSPPHTRRSPPRSCPSGRLPPSLLSQYSLICEMNCEVLQHSSVIALPGRETIANVKRDASTEK